MSDQPTDNQTTTIDGITIIPIETPSLGDRSYLAHDGRVALVVDPQRDLDRVEDLLAADNLELLVVAESHIHNDYVTGGHALAAKTGATYLVNADDEVSFERTPVRDGETVEVGDRMRLRAVATPGHTFTHLSYVLSETSTGEQVAVFSGGSLLFGATGRPDLLGQEHTDELVRLQHRSAHRLANALPDAAQVLPTHGFGSFCSATQSDATSSTVGQEKASNPALTQDEDTYVSRAARRTRCVAGLLRPHGARPTPPARARPTSRLPARPTRPSSVPASRPGSGSWTCATAPRSRPGTRPAPSTSVSTALSPPTWAG